MAVFWRPWRAGGLIVLLACTCLAGALAESAVGTPAALLRARYEQLQPQLLSNSFQRPLYLESVDNSRQTAGDVFALIDFPFFTVRDALATPAHWCEVLILHLNTKYCAPKAGESAQTITVSVGKKQPQSLEQAYSVDFTYAVTAATPDYFSARMLAKSGPFGTSNYLIGLSAIPVLPGKTFLHLNYSYAHGLLSRLAMQTYLLTIGSGKPGFTRENKPAGDPATYVGGMRGAVERNTMRYYLAIDAYLASLALPADLQREARLKHWFASTEQYATQLHELDFDTYLAMKRSEILRMQRQP